MDEELERKNGTKVESSFMIRVSGGVRKWLPFGEEGEVIWVSSTFWWIDGGELRRQDTQSHDSEKGHVNQCSGALVKQLKIVRKEKVNIKNNSFSSFKK